MDATCADRGSLPGPMCPAATEAAQSSGRTSPGALRSTIVLPLYDEVLGLIETLKGHLGPCLPGPVVARICATTTAAHQPHHPGPAPAPRPRRAVRARRARMAELADLRRFP